MNAETYSLWQRLANFSLDREDATLPFSARLARDNGWSHAYALRVVHEYKRFMLLGIVADHVVTPSDQVDQAWHLHLTYTRSYWVDLCEGVLGRRIHHDPTTGIEEQVRFVELYERTRQTYRRVFGEPPPADIWPPATIRFGEDVRNRWVNLSRNWIIPKPRWLRVKPSRKWRQLVLGGCLLPPVVAAAGNPFAAGGFDFLLFYVTLFVAALVASLLLRRILGPHDEVDAEADDVLTPLEVAFLSGGMQRAIFATIAGMVQSGTLRLITSQRRLLGLMPWSSEQRIATTQITPTSPDVLEQAIYTAASAPGGASDADVRKAAYRVVTRIRDRLAQRGLVGAAPFSSAGSYVPMLVMLSVAVVGFAQIVHGISRERPVGFLIAATIITVVVGLFFLKRERVTRQGRQLVELMQRKHAYLSSAARSRPEALKPGEVSMAVALFGVTAIAHGPMASLAQQIETFRYTGSSATGGCGAGGCGAGGCGGGCGGCGGCGG